MTTPQRPDLRGELLQRAERDQPAARAITAQVDAGDVRIRYVGR